VYIELPYSIFIVVLSVYKLVYLILIIKVLSFIIVVPLFVKWIGLVLQIGSISGLVVGFAAVSQTHVKTILALTTTTQVGYILALFSVWTPGARLTAFIYFFWYLLHFILIIACFVYLEKYALDVRYTSDLRAVYSYSSFIWIVLVIVFFSLAGLPFSGIFLLKFILFKELYSGGAVLLIGLVIFVNITQMIVYVILLLELFTGFEKKYFGSWSGRLVNLSSGFFGKNCLELILLILIAVIGFLVITSILWLPACIFWLWKFLIFLFG
jgi:NADH-quinone oxidoreductase subunit N